MDTELLLINGNFHTMDPARPRATAVAIRDDRFVAVGDSDELLEEFSNAGVVDLGGETVVPGFIDAHIHFMAYGLSLREIDLANTPSLEIALDRVRNRAAETPPGQWLTGRGWDQSLWGDGAFPSGADLDAISTEHPIFLRRKCGHAGWANSAALKLAAITSATPDPEGGEIVRDAAGQPTGILLETAMHALFALVAEPDDEQAAAAVREAQAVVHKMGIVGVHTMEAAPALRAFQRLRADGELRLRIVSQIPVSELDDAIRLGLQTGLGDEWLRIGGVKVFSDGALGPRTAWMLAPYENEPDNTGIAVTDAEAMADIVERATSAGIAVVTHAIGDRANRMVLDALEASRKAGVGLHLRHELVSFGGLTGHSTELPDLGIRVAERGRSGTVPPGDADRVELVAEPGEVATDHDEVRLERCDRLDVGLESRQVVRQLQRLRGMVRELVDSDELVAGADREEHLGVGRAERDDPLRHVDRIGR